MRLTLQGLLALPVGSRFEAMLSAWRVGDKRQFQPATARQYSALAKRSGRHCECSAYRAPTVRFEKRVPVTSGRIPQRLESHCREGLDWSGVSVEALQNNRYNFRSGPS